MKNSCIALTVFLAFLVVMGWTYVLAQSAQSPPPRPRFEFLLVEEGVPSNGWRMNFLVYHDRETGQEIVCSTGGLAAMACYPTGRKW